MSQYALFIENMIQQFHHKNIEYKQLVPWVNYFSMLIRSPGGFAGWEDYKKILSRTLTDTLDEQLEKHRDRPNIIDVVPHFFGITSTQSRDDNTKQSL